MKNLTIGLITFFCLYFDNVIAQDFARQGIWEIGGRINYTSTTSVNNGEANENSLNSFALYVPVYYFVIDGLSLGLIPGYENLSNGDNSSSLLNILAGIAYNIKTNSTVYPYLEGRIGFNSYANGTSRSGIVWILSGGMKVQAGGNALVNIGLFYEQRTLESSNNEGGRDGTNAFGLDVGLAVFFGNSE